jgi:hypothetical protein
MPKGRAARQIDLCGHLEYNDLSSSATAKFRRKAAVWRKSSPPREAAVPGFKEMALTAAAAQD